MWARILGSAAGGGFPQWNCSCRNCDGARTGEPAVRARTQAALAVSADRHTWYLVNATPDVGRQLGRLPRPENRGSPTVLLTDAELDHTAGLLSLREGDGLTVYSTAAILRAAAPLLDLLAAYQPLDLRILTPGVDTALDGLTVRALDTGSTKVPRYATGGGAVGYRFTDAAGRTLVYLPCARDLTPALTDELRTADCTLLDGTCWTDDEMALVGKPEQTSRSMGHAPVVDTLPVYAALPAGRRFYTHLNNTNPLLVEDSPERRTVEAAGIEVAHDGTEIQV